MKILLYCPVFYPMVGGMETVTECMGELFIKKGHECKVMTPIKYDGEDKYAFEVHRAPDFFSQMKLILWADIIVSKGAALRILPMTKLFFKPFVWIHSGYQASCIDGLGWVDGEPAPMDPIGSIKYHYRRKGLSYVSYEAVKLYLRRFASKHLVSMNVAVTDWVANRQPFKRQVRIYNPFPIFRFADYKYEGRIEYDFVYLGRLVSEKGLPTLIQAFKIVLQDEARKGMKLLIIGDGDWRKRLENMAEKLGIANNIDFVGRKTGEELTRLVYKSNIAVIPSEWEEPMGGVALELLASGRSIIISKNGGLAECIGEAGLTFCNGDYNGLAEVMMKLLIDKELAAEKRALTNQQVAKFNPEDMVQQYLDLFNKILKRKVVFTKA